MTSSLIASLLAGSWRQIPPAPELSIQELNTIAPLLIASGGGALAYWKIRGTALESTEAGQELKQAYRLYTLHAAIHEAEINSVINLLADVGVEPILVKGWSMARHYPEAALRPYGDIDLFVRPEQYDAAVKALATDEGRQFFVDLHRGSEHLCDQPFEDLWERSTVISTGKSLLNDKYHMSNDKWNMTPASTQVVSASARTVRVLSPEDHLRILCVHFLHHGAWRPAALCDIGLLIEKHKTNFDWNVCLTTNQTRARWVECTVGLAQQLLGAESPARPLGTKPIELPRWLLPAVLKEWENPVSVDHVVPPPLADRLAHPIDTIKAIRRRWPPNPIQATVVMNGPFNEWPRIIFQAGNFLSRTGKFLLPNRKA